ncbi:NEDD4-binding protein 1 [Anolis carolinensis]|uniref:NEDD4-binding protein 1 n=1 Tax=Anolis carolinensis TaxID=28377 RepID=UPI002F2B8301
MPPGPVMDEFTAPAEKSGCLERSRASIERLFRVRLCILGALNGGGWDSGGEQQQQGPAKGRRIWLSLLGETGDVRSAKEYIKGLCEPELEEREYYPKEMHCIFVGAQNLFLNCLIQRTSADVTVVEIGTLNIKGGAEPVVMARSHIQQFVSLFKNNASISIGGESEVKKRFKHLVEAHADKYTMDLLILPNSLKRELLSLAQKESFKAEVPIIDLVTLEGTSELSPNQMQQRPGRNHDCRTGKEEERNNAGTPVTELADRMNAVFPDTSERHFLPINGMSPPETSAGKERQSCKRRSSEAEERLPKKQFSLENNQESQRIPPAASADDDVVLIDLVTNSSNELDDPHGCTKEGDEISEEMEYKILVNFFKSMGYSQQIVEKVIAEHGQLAEPLLLLEEIEKESKKGSKDKNEAVVAPQTVWAKKDKGSSSSQGLGCMPEPSRNAKQSVVSVGQAQSKTEGNTYMPKSENQTALSSSQNPQHKARDIESDGYVNRCNNEQWVLKDKKLNASGLVARGISETPRPPIPKGTGVEQSSTKHNQQGHCNPLQLGDRHLPSQTSNQLLDSRLPPQLTGSYPERRVGGALPIHHTDPSVTGIQRFLESLNIPYKLELKNEPGRTDVKYIVIDGSNVAMSHGLQKFFSCRGIAIAVDYFWKRGHRKITVFVPQWRTRRDCNATEQHFLTQLQDIGILALTPARVVCGARIASHDDRFLLHLAEKTGGVVVTNDNLREFVNESPSWREIIQRRLLPYTFAGDFFMVPDDPMGRNGPGLERFLEESAHGRNVPPACGPASGGLFPLPMPHFVMQPESSSRSTENRLPGLGPPLLKFPPASALPPHPRSATETTHLKEALRKIFPTSEQNEKIEEILAQHPHMRDMNALSAMVLDLG